MTERIPSAPDTVPCPVPPEIEEQFLSAYPEYDETRLLDELRETEYGRLDEQGHVYLDYTGGSLYGSSQLRAHMALLENNVFGNPHSHNPTSLAMTELVEQARAYVLEFFNADPEEYTAIFTPNASGALKLVGEAYPFAPGGTFALVADNHNSVNGIREFARGKGADVGYVPLTRPELRLDEGILAEVLGKPAGAHPRLFAYPAQSNFSGVQHPLGLVARAHDAGWDVLLDAAAFAPTNRLDLSAIRPDFVTLSFYKIFGYPTGVGALIARNDALARLRRPWFAGGTITVASVKADRHFLAAGEAAFEDGTVNYLTLPAVEHGLRHVAGIGIETIHTRVACLTGWMLERLQELNHTNGAPQVHVHGPRTVEGRGGTVTIEMLDPAGKPLDARRIEELAAREQISLRTGCFCNPGAGETAHDLSDDFMREAFAHEQSLCFDELDEMAAREGKSLSAIRVSLGIASNLADVERMITFVARFRDRAAAAVGQVDHIPDQPLRDTV